MPVPKIRILIKVKNNFKKMIETLLYKTLVFSLNILQGFKLFYQHYITYFYLKLNVSLLSLYYTFYA